MARHPEKPLTQRPAATPWPVPEPMAVAPLARPTLTAESAGDLEATSVHGSAVGATSAATLSAAVGRLPAAKEARAPADAPGDGVVAKALPTDQSTTATT